MADIIERLNNDDQFMDAIDDAVHEIEELRGLLKEDLPFVEDMVGIASSARPIRNAIVEYFNGTGK